MDSKKKILFLVMLLVPSAWLWGLYHCQIGEWSGWVFPKDSLAGPDINGMVLWDWLFYPITIFFFTTIILFDPFKKLLDKDLFFATEEVLKLIFYILLVVMICLSFVWFGKSGQATTLFFMIPCLAIYIYIWNSWDIMKFIRTGLLVVPMEILWDHLAVGRYQQWIYIRDAGIWGELWINNIPVEMTPYIGIAGWYFNFGLVFMFKKVLESK